VEASTYDALNVLTPESFDLVFTGIGAICWLPSITSWAAIISGLLKPGGHFFMREGHPMMWSLDEKITSGLSIRYPYFETEKPMEFDDDATYVELEDPEHKFQATRTMEWNHGLGEIIQALVDNGMEITGLVEHKSVPWEALPGQMVELGNGEFLLPSFVVMRVGLFVLIELRRRIRIEGGEG
jgi:hypothetical protein